MYEFCVCDFAFLERSRLDYSQTKTLIKSQTQVRFFRVPLLRHAHYLFHSSQV